MKNYLRKRKIFAQLLILLIILIIGIKWSSIPVENLDEFDQERYYNVEIDNHSRAEKLEINSAEEWLKFANDVRKGKDYSNYNIYLTADLDFSCYENVIPVGTYHTPFRGAIFGNNHTISNLKLFSEEEYVGLFGVVENAMIQELSLQNCMLQATSAVGAGGVVGLARNSQIKKCIFNGTMIGREGSIGGIVGNNWSFVYDSSVYGKILGTTQNGMYNLQEGTGSYGTGGIVGHNGGTIFKCKNYAEILDDSQEHESNTVRSGGVSGYNNGWIDTCVNYGKITGGGIVKSNLDYATIRCCVNFGDVYSGIAIGSYQNSEIEYCINLGKATGRYSGDIVSFWGQDAEDNEYGAISNCLYVNSSKSGVANIKSFKASTLINNRKINITDEKDVIQFERYLETDDYRNAYRFLVEKERKRRLDFVVKIFLLGVFFFLGLNGIIGIQKWRHKNKIYKMGKSYFTEKKYWDAYKALCEIRGYKDSEDIIKKSINELLIEGDITGILCMGEYSGNKIEWHKIEREDGENYYIAANVLAADRIHGVPVAISWKETELVKKLNSVYKDKWFGKQIDNYLDIDISIPKIENITQFYPLSQQRKCRNLYKIDGILMNSGTAYWWLRSNQKTDRMPFVTSDGLISERGRSITVSNIAVRPIIRIRVLYENNL